MKITLDLDTNEITVPKNFFETVDKQNQLIAQYNGEPVKALDRIKKAFNTAMADTDKYLHVRKK